MSKTKCVTLIGLGISPPPKPPFVWRSIVVVLRRTLLSAKVVVSSLKGEEGRILSIMKERHPLIGTTSGESSSPSYPTDEAREEASACARLFFLDQLSSQLSSCILCERCCVLARSMALASRSDLAGSEGACRGRDFQRRQVSCDS